ncbi:Ternary complex factor MIP1 leucine-zipper-containing protein [Dioscorea alata]|uniref:Ternary complex factor MIP1 leucine-zipper-containing protein n=1 Tax=Dioscorea alata TaxID=55571 RepID=A0ACB7U4W3_DIOAL|nr:Ternary complex factor MIP1 leucine-zipper-containing protein [Dioscorea alata]
MAFWGLLDSIGIRGSSTLRATHKGSDLASSSDGSATCSGFEDGRNSDDRKGKDGNMCRYRCQLEQEVQKLQMQLQQEFDLHVVLADAVGKKTLSMVNSPSNLPDKAQELLANIAALEITVSKLEEELVLLQFRLSHERTERHLAENSLNILPVVSPKPPESGLPGYTWEEHLSSLQHSKFNESQMLQSTESDICAACRHPQEITTNSDCNMPVPCGVETGRNMMDVPPQQTGLTELKQSFLTNLWQNPNRLSEEMVRCMRNVFLCLSKSSSPIPFMATSAPEFCSPGFKMNEIREPLTPQKTFDPYQVSGKMSWKNAGSYSLAAEVSWMCVGKTQLEYAAEALKGFRFLVEQLAKVNPSCMSANERLAFWINLYNTLIMHAYLAYGVPKSDMKLFSLMQKVSYTVGGCSFSAAEIEFVILKMKPPAYRPQIALILALHKFKISEEHKRYSIDSSEPLVVFALSCGMYSSPAVRVFTAENVREELQNSMRDYMRAYIGINNKVTVVRDSASQWKQRLLGVRSFSIIPFDTRFRYLFLPDGKGTLQGCS